MPKKILIFSEPLTLSHFLRPLEVAKSLYAEGYDVHFATTSSSPNLAQHLGSIKTITLKPHIRPSSFIEAVTKGGHPFTVDILTRQVKEDMELIKEIQPALVMGDMRFSLHISTHKLGVKYVNLSNSYWDPSAKLPTVIPDLPIVSILGEGISKFLFSIVKPIIFWNLARPFNKVARAFKAPEFGNYLDVVSSGQYTFYFDCEGLIKRSILKPNKIEIGPMLYSIKMEAPKNAKKLSSKPAIFLSLGSSGPFYLLPKMLDVLSRLDVEAFVATAGRAIELPFETNIHVFEYLPFEEMVNLSDCVITSGGSSNVYPALKQGKPVLMIPLNYDQHLFSEAIRQTGAGLKIRSGSFNKKIFEKKTLDLIHNPTYKIAASRIQSEFFNIDPQRKLVEKVNEILAQTQAN